MSGSGAKGRPAHASPGPLGEHNLSFTTTDLNLVEMTEVEYTQLQHILYSHMEAQANDGDMDARLSSALFSACGAADAAPQQPAASAGPAGYSSATPAVYPVVCQPGLAPDTGGTGSGQCLGHGDFQELRMMLLSESNLPASQADKTPNASCVDIAGHGLARAKHSENMAGANKENVLPDHSPPAPEPRSKSAVRVRLEDRFNSIQVENPRCQEPQEPGATLNNLVTLIRQPAELMGVPLHQQPNKCTTLVKNKTAATTTALQFAYPLFSMNACSSTGNVNPSQAQSSGASCTIVEATKHQDLGLPRAFSFCYHQEIESTKQTVGARNKALPEQVWIKVGEALCKQAINKRSCSRLRQLDTNADRKPLGEIQNMCDSQNTTSAQGSWQAAQSNSSVQAQNGMQGGISQRRERHNRMERDRRRRIRICCDELNLLVPFCTADTDKATTLQWTTAFLKYIQERHGDSLKKEFETVFCGKTGRRLKLTRPDSLVTCPMQENMQNSTTVEKK
ncbi:PREDICTED: transcription factor-like 5 protein isoform X2 [Gavialis gangeticus]|uniref:transcription factor-like 5 protein isoform X2 n=1 Tax=Gavialis gangeticus TaxID=94835 RepID=UPI00092FB0AD|nr:PREDICTED: transcription factor-like 5 protein isoform X2 [Gavialis gangeticus]